VYDHSISSPNVTGPAAATRQRRTWRHRWGWTVGAGIEQALTEKWSIVGEYKYIDLGSSTVRFAGVPDDIAEVASQRINQRYQAVTLGLNYKLN